MKVLIQSLVNEAEDSGGNTKRAVCCPAVDLDTFGGRYLPSGLHCICAASLSAFNLLALKSKQTVAMVT